MPKVSLKLVGSIVALWLFLSVIVCGHAVGLDESPTSFFTNLADRLLQSKFGVSLTRIEVYPTNYYISSVHRLIQVAANIYDASTNSPDSACTGFPSVFRPLISRNGSNIFVS